MNIFLYITNKKAIKTMRLIGKGKVRVRRVAKIIYLVSKVDQYLWYIVRVIYSCARKLT